MAILEETELHNHQHYQKHMCGRKVTKLLLFNLANFEKKSELWKHIVSKNIYVHQHYHYRRYLSL